MSATTHHEQTPSRMVAGALAHLATHMETGCPRAAYLAAMLLEQVANDTASDAHLRRHARELIDILERENTTHDTTQRTPGLAVAESGAAPAIAPGNVVRESVRR